MTKTEETHTLQSTKNMEIQAQTDTTDFIGQTERKSTAAVTTTVTPN